MSDQILQRIDHPPLLPPRPADGHKGTFGRVLVVGGHPAMIGAPVLAATAALRSGSGLVQIAVEASILPVCLSITPELIGLGLEADGGDELRQAAEQADVIILGPGLGQSKAAAARVNRLIRLDRPTVIDADALNLLAAMGYWPDDFKARAVLTPHPGEMKRLGALFGRSEIARDEKERIDLATRAARAFKQVILLKGHRTVVVDADGFRVYVNSTGDVTLAKAGSGDVLSGIIGSLLGQGMAPFDAASLGAHLHGLAGEEAGRSFGRRSAMAMDVIGCIHKAMADLES